MLKRLECIQLILLSNGTDNHFCHSFLAHN